MTRRNYEEEMQAARDARDPRVTSKSQWGKTPQSKASRKPAEFTRSVQEESSLFGGTVRKEGRGKWKKTK